MRLSIQPGEVFADVLKRYRPSDRYKITILSPYKWGHVVQINNDVKINYKAGTDYFFDDLPVLNVSNMGEIDHHDLHIDIQRLND